MLHILYIIQFPEDITRYIVFLSGTDCDSLPKFENAIPIDHERESYRSGEQVAFKCAPSYHMNGSNIVTCANSLWVGELICKGSLINFQCVFIIVSEDWLKGLAKFNIGQRLTFKSKIKFAYVWNKITELKTHWLS